MYDRFTSGGRLAAVVILASAVLTACGGGGGSESSAANAPPAGAGTANKAPVIVGNAPTVVAAGSLYSFTPSASDPDQDSLTFTIDSKPNWASFDSKTGRISGTPAAADVGSHENIIVKVTDGKSTTALPEFAVNVMESGKVAKSATLSWQAPAENTDGTALENLTGYKILYGTKPGTYTQTINVNTVGVTTYVVDNLAPGTYYFAITAVTKVGESDFSGEASATIG